MEISELLNMQPRLSQNVGARRSTPKGELLPGTNKLTFCTFPLAKGPDSKLIAAIRDSNKSLLTKQRHIRSIIRSGGRLEYFLGLFLNGNSGFELDVEIAEELAKLGVKLSLDIYPPEAKKKRTRL
jgi:hypothetical protein